MSIKTIMEVWDKLWFRQDSPAAICLYRIFYGILALLCVFFWLPDLQVFFGPKGIAYFDTMLEYIKSPRLCLFFVLPRSEEVVVYLFSLTVLSGICLTLGLFTRLSSIVFWICLVSFHHRNPAILNSGDTLLRILGFLLIFSPCGRMFSLDAWLARRRGEAPTDLWQIQDSTWAQSLMRLQVAALYCQTFWAKFVGDTWWNGTAVYYSSRLQEFSRFPVPYIFDNLWTCQLLTWGALSLELALWTLIWVKEFRYWVLLAGLIFHLGLEWCMNIPLFQWIMISSFVLFIDAKDLKRSFEFLLKKFSQAKPNTKAEA